MPRDVVTEEDINSEVELIKGRDLLEKVVLECDLASKDGTPRLSDMVENGGHTDLRVPRAVRALESALKVEPIKKSNLIGVVYASPDPELSAHVLNVLATLYLAKHLAVHRPPGEFDFFQQQTDRYRKSLEVAESRVAEFGRQKNAVSPQIERDLITQKTAEFEVGLQQTRATIAETSQRVRALEAELQATPSRMKTQVRSADNAALVGQLKSALLNLELKRTELLGKFEPSYGPVQEVEAQIAQTKVAIAAEQKNPVADETTDRNPTYQWLNEELAKAKADLPSMRARADETERIIASYRSRVVELDQKALIQQDLVRNAKAEESNYLLYLNKKEEARISDALDNKRIVNVAIAQTATVPALPVHSSAFFILLGVMLAIVTSLALAFVSEFFDPCFQTPEELEDYLNVPVLAAMPKHAA
jgi:uncharacterized protein involved in exopolysaccharide biosynthesis